MGTHRDEGGSALRDHWQWRPEWTRERPCLYWYLAVDDRRLAAAWEQVLAPLRRAPWLDVVPPRWWHVTLCDVGFADEVESSTVDTVARAVMRAVAELREGDESLRLACGPVEPLASAVAVRVGPSDRLSGLQAAVADATQEVVGDERPLVHRGPFRPHLSLGYANRRVTPAEVAPVLDALPFVPAVVEVDRLSLVAVTRQDGHYRWTVERELSLRAPALVPVVARSRARSVG